MIDARSRRFTALVLCSAIALCGRRGLHHIVALLSPADRDLPPSACAHAGCAELLADHDPLPWARADTVILSGRSTPPSMLETPIDELARRVAALHPRLVVADTCFGMRLEFAEALVRHGWRGWLVGSTALLPREGIHYPEAFWQRTESDRMRAALLTVRKEFQVTALHLDAAALTAPRRELDCWLRGYDPQRGAEMLDWVDPPLHVVEVDGQRAFIAHVPQERAP